MSSSMTPLAIKTDNLENVSSGPVNITYTPHDLTHNAMITYRLSASAHVNQLDLGQ